MSALDIFIQQLLNGLILGSMYALIALGYTMVYGILGIINFAHGDVLMIGALTGLSAIKLLQNVNLALNLPDWLTLFIAILIAMAVCGLTSYAIERMAYRPLRKKKSHNLAPLITAISMSLILQTLAMIIWGRSPLQFPQLLSTSPIQVFGTQATITGKELFVMLISIIVMCCLIVLVNKTKMGRAMRATSENQKVAGLMGVNPNFIISITFIIGGSLAALAGVMIATNYGNAHFYMGFMPGLKAFTAAVLGGIGNLGGAMVGGLLLGVIEALGAGYIGDFTNGVFGSNYQDIFAFIVLIVVLVFRPSGIMGQRTSDRA
jgi:branched-chain amino acid transport system permease protein